MSTPSQANVSFALLDRAVVTGRADEPVLTGWSHARLLEEVAALGGVLHHLGVAVGVGVPIDLEAEADAVVAALAVARLGGVVHAGHGPGEAGAQVGPVVVASAGSPWVAGAAQPGVVRLVRHAGPRTAPGAPGGGRARVPIPDPSPGPSPEQDLAWDAMIRAGRTDPAACTLVDAAAAYAPGRSVAEVLADLQASPPPYAAGELRRILGV